MHRLLIALGQVFFLLTLPPPLHPIYPLDPLYFSHIPLPPLMTRAHRPPPPPRLLMAAWGNSPPRSAPHCCGHLRHWSDLRAEPGWRPSIGVRERQRGWGTGGMAAFYRCVHGGQ